MKVERCSICSKGDAMEKEGTRRVVIDGKMWSLRNDRFMYCPQCRTKYYSGEQARISSERLMELRRGERTHLFTSRRITARQMPVRAIGFSRAAIEARSSTALSDAR